ncbi:hypothetical protein QJS66_18650 [Kocuria rhizophila]|nr:hypothetical protein QJS66_18650 [Kocuria rhizophila]
MPDIPRHPGRGARGPRARARRRGRRSARTPARSPSSRATTPGRGLAWPRPRHRHRGAGPGRGSELTERETRAAGGRVRRDVRGGRTVDAAADPHVPAGRGLRGARRARGRAGQRVCTCLGRWSPAPPEWFEVQRATDAQAGERRAAQASRSHGRFSRNFVSPGLGCGVGTRMAGHIRQACTARTWTRNSCSSRRGHGALRQQHADRVQRSWTMPAGGAHGVRHGAGAGPGGHDR